jgi:hypothetical protein
MMLLLILLQLPANWREILSSKASEHNMSTQTFEPLTGSGDDQLELDIAEQAPVVVSPHHTCSDLSVFYIS